ncbi:Lipoprotein amino terminal region [Popillia japonica]|uniref:Lipoprotein amino terminal region n=1 Tax=Popillia japonica TaxID=7064 RepID=A0AAW1L3V0_POPJA
MDQLVKDDDDIIEVVKHKNYSNYEQLPAYHYGLSNMDSDSEPGTNQMNEYMTRSTFTRAIITGDLKQHIIQSCMTVNKIAVSPTRATW